MDRTCRHDDADDFEIIDGYEVYLDVETEMYVAAHPEDPVSSCGETQIEALRNVQEAAEMYDQSN